MNQPPAPTTGANFSCPCDLISIRPNLQALAAKAKANGGQLTPTQARLYLQLYDAWQYYRGSQPARFRGEVDGLCDAIGDLPVVVAAA
jgi:hypothetical protein